MKQSDHYICKLQDLALAEVRMGILIADASDRIVYVNKNMLRYLDCKRPVIGRKVTDCLSKKGFGSLKCHFIQAKKSLKPVKCGRVSFLIKNREQISKSVCIMPIKKKGSLDSVLFCFGGCVESDCERQNKILRESQRIIQKRDEVLKKIKNRLTRTNTELSKERNRLEHIISKMGDGVLVVNEINDIEIINAKALELLGYKKIEQIPSGFKSFFIHNLWQDLYDSNSSLVIKEIEFERPKHLVLSVVLASIKEKGVDKGFVAVLRDITLEKSVEKMKSDFFASVSHEIRAPLTVMKESLRILLDGLAGQISEQQKKFLSMLNNNMDRLLRLVNDLLDLSKMEAGKLILQKTQGDVNSLVKEVADSMLIYASDKKIKISLNLAPELPECYFDKDRITQVLVNLLTNALKFTPENGSIELRSSIIQSNIVVCVQDSGIGIAPENMKDLFDKYKQMSESNQIKGTGLGLSISKAIMELHNGKIWAQSKPGKGSSFFFSLPI